MGNYFITFSALAFAASCAAIAFIGPTTNSGVDYAKVDLILRNNNCVDCHSHSVRAFAGLHLTTLEGMIHGGKNGSAVSAGNSKSSLIMSRILDTGPMKMPPQGGSLKPADVDTIRRWIDEGAKPSPYSEALQKYYASADASDWKQALAACEEIRKIKVDGVPTPGIAARLSLPVCLNLKDEDGWYRAANVFVDYRPLNAGLLSDTAWAIVDPKSTFKRRDANLALKAALLAAENSNRRSGAILDTLAWAYNLKGDKAKALATEKEALTCKDATGETRKSLEESLKAFGG